VRLTGGKHIRFQDDRMNRVIRLFRSCRSAVECQLVLLVARMLGVSWAVQYLRNPNPKVAVRLLRAFGATIGELTTIKRSLLIDNAFEDTDSAGDFSHLRIGRNCYIGDGVCLDLANCIELGDDVVLSGRVAILTHGDCNRSQAVSMCYPRVCLPVRVESGAWVSYDSVLTPGVTVGECSVVGAKSFVRRDVEPHFLYAGVPAEKVRFLDG